ncbi:hypothetical protein [Alienimonas chondri]|uniref:Uncharacterized protein n=1 Tax=Alienimonas chondri TaxID=2681879 RepID=A0ABX1VI40_9PLAN|nr:hypothetical protein [Alienimonas chondri]NNJ26897.1 hypothetical protein [Alienimonas chondri]
MFRPPVLRFAVALAVCAATGLAGAGEPSGVAKTAGRQAAEDLPPGRFRTALLAELDILDARRPGAALAPRRGQAEEIIVLPPEAEPEPEPLPMLTAAPTKAPTMAPAMAPESVEQTSVEQPASLEPQPTPTVQTAAVAPSGWVDPFTDQSDAEADRLAREAAALRAATERADAVRAAAARLKQERLEAEQATAERLERQRLERDRMERARLEREALAAKQAEAARRDAARLEAARKEAERVEAERLETIRKEAERVAAVRRETQRRAAETKSVEVHTRNYGRFCPVALRDEQRLTPAVAEISTSYDGHVWRFATPAARAAFVKNPSRYRPAVGGKDVVLMRAEGFRVAGRPELSAVFGNELYLFASVKTRAAFLKNPRRFVPANPAADGT